MHVWVNVCVEYIICVYSMTIDPWMSSTGRAAHRWAEEWYAMQQTAFGLIFGHEHCYIFYNASRLHFFFFFLLHSAV